MCCLLKSITQKKGLPTEIDEESCFVDKVIEISNLDLIRDMVNILNLGKVFTENRKDYILSNGIISI